MKQEIIEEIIRLEGGYVNDPSDSGGETNFGVTKAVARKHGYTAPMKDMPKSVACDIYQKLYWDKVKGDDLLNLSELVAREVVDTAVNMGVNRAGRFLQRALNVLTDSDLLEDGIIGSKTITSMQTYIQKRGDETLSKALNCLQGAFYIELAEKRKKDKRFVYGWLKHRVNI